LEAHSGILPSGRTMIQSGILPMEVSCGPFITSCRPAFRLQTIITFSTTGDDIPFGDVIVEGLQLRDIIVPPLELGAPLRSRAQSAPYYSGAHGPIGLPSPA